MTGDGKKVLDIKVSDVKAQAPVFHEQSVALATALKTLTTALDNHGAPWGDDKPGKKFAASYKPACTSLESSVGIAVLGLVSVFEAMNDMADGHVDNDEALAGIFKKIPKPHDKGDDK